MSNSLSCDFLKGDCAYEGGGGFLFFFGGGGGLSSTTSCFVRMPSLGVSPSLVKPRPPQNRPERRAFRYFSYPGRVTDAIDVFAPFKLSPSAAKLATSDCRQRWAATMLGANNT